MKHRRNNVVERKNMRDTNRTMGRMVVNYSFLRMEKRYHVNKNQSLCLSNFRNTFECWLPSYAQHITSTGVGSGRVPEESSTQSPIPESFFWDGFLWVSMAGDS